MKALLVLAIAGGMWAISNGAVSLDQMANAAQGMFLAPSAFRHITDADTATDMRRSSRVTVSVAALPAACLDVERRMFTPLAAGCH